MTLCQKSHTDVVLVQLVVASQESFVLRTLHFSSDIPFCGSQFFTAALFAVANSSFSKFRIWIVSNLRSFRAPSCRFGNLFAYCGGSLSDFICACCRSLPGRLRFQEEIGGSHSPGWIVHWSSAAERRTPRRGIVQGCHFFAALRTKRDIQEVHRRGTTIPPIEAGSALGLKSCCAVPCKYHSCSRSMDADLFSINVT